ncbi:uncharacterized protein [Salmo salar]|uniref:Uncharacterized protein n=1 Tax=Salmo salar TaxID=8030 RepID=A0A1S3RZV2_SALSA|nr:uncharacterized protein LOC106605931 [Salmo salar]|eukprot:XP_014057409.1 PREDICTED: uncharacterized protein LOC106605931 [Salmo salar]
MLNYSGCWISCVIRMVSMKLICVFLVSQLGSCVSAQTVGCNTVHANGTTTYQLSEPLPGSPSTCVTQWLDANNSNREVECLSNCSVKPFDQEPIEPEHKRSFGDWCVSGITFGLAFGISAAVVIIILVLLIFYKIHIHRVRVSWTLGEGEHEEPSPDPEKPQSHPAPKVKYSAVKQRERARECD